MRFVFITLAFFILNNSIEAKNINEPTKPDIIHLGAMLPKLTNAKAEHAVFLAYILPSHENKKAENEDEYIDNIFKWVCRDRKFSRFVDVDSTYNFAELHIMLAYQPPTNKVSNKPLPKGLIALNSQLSKKPHIVQSKFKNFNRVYKIENKNCGDKTTGLLTVNQKEFFYNILYQNSLNAKKDK